MDVIVSNKTSFKNPKSVDNFDWYGITIIRYTIIPAIIVISNAICVLGINAVITNTHANSALLKKNTLINWNRKGLFVFKSTINVLNLFLKTGFFKLFVVYKMLKVAIGIYTITTDIVKAIILLITCMSSIFHDTLYTFSAELKTMLK